MMQRRLLLVSLFAALPVLAEGEVPVVELSHARILLSDYAPGAPAELRNIDLGQAPEPGKSRYLGQGEVRKVLRQLGVAASLLKLPERVRLVTPCHQMAPEDFSAWLVPSLRAALPEGVVLDGVRLRDPVIIADGIQVGSIYLPEFPKRDGKQTQLATVEVLWNDQVIARPYFEIQLHTDPSRIGKIVERGSTVELRVRRGSVQIAVMAQTVGRARVGDTVSLRISTTGKLLSARLTGPERAEFDL